jgi:hypothetical protein
VKNVEKGLDAKLKDNLSFNEVNEKMFNHLHAKLSRIDQKITSKLAYTSLSTFQHLMTELTTK